MFLNFGPFVPYSTARYYGNIVSDMLRWMGYCIAGNLGSGNSAFTMRTGLAARHLTYLQVYPLSHYAIFPLVFRRQVE